MSEHHDHYADASHEDQFEKEMRGYSRRQVDEFVARARSQSRELEDRLSRALDDNERLRLELSSARQAADEKPAHAEISERVGQILKLADDEAKAQKGRAADEIAKLRNEAKTETDKLRAQAKQETEKFQAEAQEQAERMLGAAQEQAENSIASSRAEAEKTRTAARTEAERSVGDAHKQAETTLSTAKAQASTSSCRATPRPSGD
jgi:cell division septum initiation protein DivIVA